MMERVKGQAGYNNYLLSDIDIQVDWLYKGKRKLPKSSSVTGAPATSGQAILLPKNDSHTKQKKQRSMSISNAVLSSENKVLLPAKSSLKNSGSSDNSNSNNNTNTIPNANSGNTFAKQVEDAFALPNEKKSNIKRSNSINTAHMHKSNSLSPASSRASTPSITPGSSQQEKPKKSLFGSLFGRRTSTSSGSHQTSTSGLKSSIEQPPATAPASYNNGLSVQTNFVTNNASNITASPLLEHTPTPTQIRARRLTTGSTVSSESTESSTINSRPNLLDESIVDTTSLNKISDIPLKRVVFAVDSFESDPPQQLPSRKPRQGNILIPEHMISAVPSISVGISNTTTPTPTASSETNFDKNSKEYKIAVDNFRRLQKESEKHQQEAHFAAQRIANEVLNYRTHSINHQTAPTQNTNDTKLQMTETNIIDEEPFDQQKIHSIDKPIHAYERHFVDEDQSSEDEAEGKKITLDVVYTRCCHLREILPIPSTLKQVTGKTAPLQVLKFLNPKPTLIDILSFCDFIAIIPINTIIFDNVNLTPVMFRILITSLSSSTSLEKLGLRNVVFDKESWYILCKFLLTNKTLRKIDLSQTKVRSDLPENLHRHNMDWDLFAEVLLKRVEFKDICTFDEPMATLEELLLNGVKVTNIPRLTFKNVLNSFATAAIQETNLQNINEQQSVIDDFDGDKQETHIRLGLASTDIDSGHTKTLMNWTSKFGVQGIDLSFNDLSELIKTIVSKLSSLDYKNLEYFTLNNTNILKGYDVALILKYLAKLPNLKFLDLSNLPQIFPEVFPFLHKYLPRFPQLQRIHFDNNNLHYKDISMICTILLKCPKITHVSLLTSLVDRTNIPSSSNTAPIKSNGEVTKTENSSQASTPTGSSTNFLAFYGSLYTLVKDSPNLISLDINYDEIPQEFSSRIALCLVRNMNRMTDSGFELDELTSQDDLLFDGTIMTETAEKLIQNLDRDTKAEDSTRKYLFKKYIEKLQNVHKHVSQTIDQLFEKQHSGDISLQEKENLLRLLLVEQNLTHILDTFSNIPQLAPIMGSYTPSLKHHHSETHIDLMENPSNANAQVAPSRPHLMATDSGRVIDVFTGKPLLTRKSSMAIEGSKKQEEEEGELHKWGFFVQQQQSLYPDNELPLGAKSPVNSSSAMKQSSPRVPDIQISNKSSGSNTPTSFTGKDKSWTTNPYPSTNDRVFAKIPSGEEVRGAVIKAKGIDSINDLIDSVNQKTVDLGSIYGETFRSTGLASPSEHTNIGTLAPENKTPPPLSNETPVMNMVSSPIASPKRLNEQSLPFVDGNCNEVKEKYDEVLNNLSTVRLNKN